VNEARGLWLARAVLVAGMLASLALLSQSPRVEVFWSGDGGLKHMMAKQFASGKFHVDLRLTDDPEVARLWDEGLHPGARGRYVFHRDGKYFGVFPYPFSFVSAPFYAMFGMMGYYIIPMLSLWGVWIVLYLALRRTCIESWMIALLMGAIIFSTPLTLYGTAFWEHTLGIFLTITPIVYTLRHEDDEPGVIGPILAGAMLGLSAWFRPEMLALIAALLPAVFVWRLRAMGFRGWFLFCAATVCAVFCFFGLNMWIYGHPLGTHGLQVFAMDPPPTRLDQVMHRFHVITRNTIRFAPVGAFVVFVLAAALWQRRLSWRDPAVYLTVVGSLFYCLMVYMVPSDGDFQLGPRFALLAMVLLIPVGAYAWKLLWDAPNVLRVAAVVVLLLSAALGFKRTAQEGRWMISEYQNRVLPAFTFVRDREEKTVAVSHVAITTELCDLLDRKDFFAVTEDADLAKLVPALRARGVDRFLYIAFGDPNEEYDSPIQHEGAKALAIKPLGRYGTHYYCYAVTIPPA